MLLLPHIETMHQLQICQLDIVLKIIRVLRDHRTTRVLGKSEPVTSINEFSFGVLLDALLNKRAGVICLLPAYPVHCAWISHDLLIFCIESAWNLEDYYIWPIPLVWT